MPGVIQRLRLLLDEQSVAEMKRDAFAAATGVADAIVSELKRSKSDAAGKEIAIKAVAALKAQLLAKATELQDLVNKGLLSAAGAKRQGEQAGKDYANGLLTELKKAEGAGVLSTSAVGRLKGTLASTFGLDLRSFGQVPKATENVGLLSRGLGFLKTQLVSLVAPLAAFFTARELIAFGKESVKAFEEDTAALNDLRVAVERAGGSFETLAPQIEKVNLAFQRTGRLSGADFNRTLSQLIGISGDYENSLKNVSLVTDFAAKHNISLSTATDLVGKAMVGNARGLREYGVEAKNGDDAILLLRKDSQGFVDQQGPTLKKAINVLAFAWDDFKSAVGGAIVDAGGGTSAIDTLSGAVIGLTKTLKANKGEISSFFSTFAATGIKSVSDFVDNTVIEFAEIERIGDRITALGEEIQASFKKVAASIEDAIAATLEFFGDQAGGAQTRALAAGYRDEAAALEGLAKGHREAAQAAKDDATAARERLRLRESDARATAAGISGGSSSTAGVDTTDIPTGGKATRVVHPLGGGSDTLTKRISQLTRATQVEALRGQALEALGKIETDLERQLKATNLPLEKRIALEDHLNAVQRARGTLPLEKLAPAEQLGILSRTIQLTDLRAESLTHLSRLEAQFTAQMNDGTKSLEFRAAAEDNLRKVQDLRGNQPFDTLPLEQRVKLLTQATEIEQFRTGALDGLAKAEAEVRAELDSGTLALGRRIEKTAALQAIQDALGTRKIDDLPLAQQITLFQQGLGATETFASSLRGLQDAESKLAAEVQAAEPGTVRRLELERQLYDLRATLGAQSLETQIALLATALRSDETRAEAIRELIVLERELARLQQDPNRTPAARAATGQAQGAVAGALGTAPAGQVAATRAQGNLTPADSQTVIITPKIGQEAIDKIGQQTESVHDMLWRIGSEPVPVQIKFQDDLIKTFFNNLPEFALGAATSITNVFEDTFSKLLSGAENVGQALGHLGKGMAASILGELAKMSKGKVIENIAFAIEELAKGLAAAAVGNPKAGEHFHAALTFTLAAAKWGLVAGVTGGLASAAGGGGGGGGPDRSAEGNDPLKNGRAKAEIVIYGGTLDTDNTAQMDALSKAVSYIGDRDIVVRRA